MEGFPKEQTYSLIGLNGSTLMDCGLGSAAVAKFGDVSSTNAGATPHSRFWIHYEA